MYAAVASRSRSSASSGADWSAAESASKAFVHASRAYESRPRASSATAPTIGRLSRARRAVGFPPRGWRLVPLARPSAPWELGFMFSSRRSHLALLTIVGALVAAATTAPGASAAAQRYASPGGSGTSCDSAHPCDILQAVNSAAAGDEVIVRPGNYLLAATLNNTAA